MEAEEAIQEIKKQGCKTTAKRKAIIHYFANADGYRTAKDLINHMEISYRNISFDTVYRNLHLFADIGILETTELKGEKHFRLSCSHHHHHHFICKDCGNTKEVDVCPMDDIQKTLKDYVIEGHKFEIYGLCPLCQTS